MVNVFFFLISSTKKEQFLGPRKMADLGKKPLPGEGWGEQGEKRRKRRAKKVGNPKDSLQD